jgi:tetratricopeptide (TPR) repeat protein
MRWPTDDPGVVHGTVSRAKLRLGYVAMLSLSVVASGLFARVCAQEGAADLQQTVSVSELRVPSKAREAAGRGRQALIDGRFEEARKQIDRALAVDPTYGLALALHGILLLTQNKQEQAAADFEQAIQADTDLGVAYAGLGTVYINLGRFKDALVPLGQSVEILPTAWFPRFQIALAYYGDKQYDAALSELAKLKTIEPVQRSDWAASVYLNALVLLKLNDYSGAENNFEQILARCPTDSLAKEAAKALDVIHAGGNVQIGPFRSAR